MKAKYLVQRCNQQKYLTYWLAMDCGEKIINVELTMEMYYTLQVELKGHTIRSTTMPDGSVILSIEI